MIVIDGPYDERDILTCLRCGRTYPEGEEHECPEQD